MGQWANGAGVYSWITGSPPSFRDLYDQGFNDRTEGGKPRRKRRWDQLSITGSAKKESSRK
jgi:hypothetical protein